MVSDAITCAQIASAPNSRDFSKKKRTNRSAKLKQCKLDVRREQWLSQGAVKNKEYKEDQNEARKKSDRSFEKSGQGDVDNDGSMHHESDSESASNSPTTSLLCGNGGTNSGTTFIGSSSSSSSGSGSGSGGCCSGSITEEEEEEEDGCLDDWEAVADALAADDDNNKPKIEHDNSCSQSPSENQLSVQSGSSELPNGLGLDSVKSMPDGVRMVPKVSGNNTRAWRSDDAFRPQNLPNLSKQRSFPTTDRHFGRGGVPWACKNVLPAPSSCPICIEELDCTDSSFLPCLCGFRLCLFCHKRILEADGRCPGCRKPYEHYQVESEASVQEGSLTFRLARSCSMIARS